MVIKTYKVGTTTMTGLGSWLKLTRLIMLLGLISNSYAQELAFIEEKCYTALSITPTSLSSYVTEATCK